LLSPKGAEWNWINVKYIHCKMIAIIFIPKEHTCAKRLDWVCWLRRRSS
jgi:hypothetical protein